MGKTVKQKMIEVSKKAEGTPRVPFGALMRSNPPMPPKPKKTKK